MENTSIDSAKLQDYGIDYKNGLNRCLNDENLYRTLLSYFLEDESMPNAKKAYTAKDFTALFKCMHELKGACGNAGMTELYGVVSKLVETLRGGVFDEADVDSQFAEAQISYEKAREGVILFLA